MTPFIRSMFVVARRDFLAIVATPTFLLFLLAPLFMVGMGLAGGMGASQLADSARGAGRIVVVADAADVEALRSADTRLRAAMILSLTTTACSTFLTCGKKARPSRTTC